MEKNLRTDKIEKILESIEEKNVIVLVLGGSFNPIRNIVYN